MGFTPEKTTAILTASAEHLARPIRPQQPAPPQPANDIERLLAEAPPPEGKVAKWKREADEQEKEFARQRAEEARATTARQQQTSLRALRAEFDAKLAKRDAAMGSVLRA